MYTKALLSDTDNCTERVAHPGVDGVALVEFLRRQRPTDKGLAAPEPRRDRSLLAPWGRSWQRVPVEEAAEGVREPGAPGDSQVLRHTCGHHLRQD